MLNTVGVKTDQLTLKQILSVRCPVCRAKAKERCTLTTGHPSIKTHADRAVAAAKAPRPESSVPAALRSLAALASSGFRVVFPPGRRHGSKTE
jgi:hypothetical protein